MPMYYENRTIRIRSSKYIKKRYQIIDTQTPSQIQIRLRERDWMRLSKKTGSGSGSEP